MILNLSFKFPGRLSINLNLNSAEFEAKKTVITKIINKVTSLSYSNDEMIKKYKFNIYDSLFFHFQKLFESNELANVYLLVKTLEYMLSGIKDSY